MTNSISGCKIEYNTSSAFGAGIALENSTLDFSDGSVSYNKAETSVQQYVCGGGVYIFGGTLNLSGTAQINSNTVSNNYSAENPMALGGGVYIYNSGSMNMMAGMINGNTVSAPATTAASSGGGVSSYGILNLQGGTISGNTAGSLGGGIAVYGSLVWSDTAGTGITSNAATFGPNYFINTTSQVTGQINGTEYSSDTPASALMN